MLVLDVDDGLVVAGGGADEEEPVAVLAAVALGGGGVDFDVLRGGGGAGGDGEVVGEAGGPVVVALGDGDRAVAGGEVARDRGGLPARERRVVAAGGAGVGLRGDVRGDLGVGERGLGGDGGDGERAVEGVVGGVDDDRLAGL